MRDFVDVIEDLERNNKKKNNPWVKALIISVKMVGWIGILAMWTFLVMLLVILVDH